jgi:hypothetical protein
MTIQDNVPPAPPTAGLPEPSPDAGASVSGPGESDELKAFMDEYRADKKAAAEAKAEADAAAEKAAAEAKAAADAAAAAAAKPKAPAPQKKVSTKEKVSSETGNPTKEDSPKEKAYGSARYFNRRPKKVKNDN